MIRLTVVNTHLVEGIRMNCTCAIVKSIINRALLYRKLLVCAERAQTNSGRYNISVSLGFPTEPTIMSN